MPLARLGQSFLSAIRDVRTALFILFVGLYAAMLLFNPSFAKIGYEALRETIFTDGNRLPIAVFPEMGRFYPMFGMEYRVLDLVSTRIVWLYVFVSLQFLVMIWLFVRLMRQAGAAPVPTYLITGALLLIPGFTNVWVGFAATERNVMFYLAIFLLSFMAYLRNHGTAYMVLGLVCANIALYYKEPVFVALLAFAGMHLFVAWRAAEKRTRLYSALLLLSSFVFVMVYVSLIVPRLGKTLYGDTHYSPIVEFVKNLYSYAANDPVILLLLAPLTTWRLWRIVFRHEPGHPLFDPMLLAGTAYLFAFLKLNIYATNYLLPVYVFALPAIYYFLVHEKLLKRRPWKILTAMATGLIVLNAIPLGLHIMALQKYAPVNSVQAMDALASDLGKRAPGTRPSIFLDGIYRELTLHRPDFTYDRDAYFNVGEAMKRRHLGPLRFDLKSDLPPKYPQFFPKGGDPAYPYSVFNSDETWRPERGDYLVIMPATTRNVTETYLASLRQEYDLVYKTPSTFFVPDVSLKVQIKRLLRGRLPADVIHDDNTQRAPDYYIFVKK